MDRRVFNLPAFLVMLLLTWFWCVGSRNRRANNLMVRDQDQRDPDLLLAGRAR